MKVDGAVKSRIKTDEDAGGSDWWRLERFRFHQLFQFRQTVTFDGPELSKKYDLLTETTLFEGRGCHESELLAVDSL